MRQPRREIINAIKAMPPRIVPPMTTPVSIEDMSSPVITRIVKSEWLRMFLGLSMVN